MYNAFRRPIYIKPRDRSPPTMFIWDPRIKRWIEEMTRCLEKEAKPLMILERETWDLSTNKNVPLSSLMWCFLLFLAHLVISSFLIIQYLSPSVHTVNHDHFQQSLTYLVTGNSFDLNYLKIGVIFVCSQPHGVSQHRRLSPAARQDILVPLWAKCSHLTETQIASNGIVCS